MIEAVTVGTVAEGAGAGARAAGNKLPCNCRESFSSMFVPQEHAKVLQYDAARLDVLIVVQLV